MSIRQTIAEARVAQALGDRLRLAECKRCLQEQHGLRPAAIRQLLKGADAEEVLLVEKP